MNARSVPPATSPARISHRRASRWLRFALFVSVPLVLLPIVFPRKIAARRGAEPAVPSKPLTRGGQVQSMVDELKTRLALASEVTVSLVPKNALVVSVERINERQNAFRLSLEAGFVDTLSPDEIRAVVAHELGHVWIFTHHPYLHTEELANEIALRVVDRRTLAAVYDKVWAKTGLKGTLVYLPEAP